jgi:hypothetical protein
MQLGRLEDSIHWNPDLNDNFYNAYVLFNQRSGKTIRVRKEIKSAVSRTCETSKTKIGGEIQWILHFETANLCILTNHKFVYRKLLTPQRYNCYF